MQNMITSNLGYPRIGANREWKKALEQFWSGKITEAKWLNEMETIRLDHLRLQQQKGIDLIPVNDFTYYDHMLDTAVMFSLVPNRFEYEPDGPVPNDVYFAMARGNERAAACEMTKWFNTNYHYIVPELGDTTPKLAENRPLNAYREARDKLGINGKPVLIGPYTFIKLSKGYPPDKLAEYVEMFLPLYVSILQELEQEGVKWVQIDEPALVLSMSPEERSVVKSAYSKLHHSAPSLKLMLQTYFDAVDHLGEVVDYPVQGIGLDFVHDKGKHLAWIEQNGFPGDKILGCGIVDGRNIWKNDARHTLLQLDRIQSVVPADRVIVQPSCSLLHVPVSVQREQNLDPAILSTLSFANEKLDELLIIAVGSDHGNNRPPSEEPARLNTGETDTSPAVTVSDRRNKTYAERRPLQQDKWKLPSLPTTTIGSFPQTAEVRIARQKFKQGEWDEARYQEFIQEQIRKWIQIQEEIGLDVLVHGEFERNDMVEFFGEKLSGFAFTRYGWVQSYGSRCVKPPLIYDDVAYAGAMTVEETRYAASLTDKPVKGMLTGPVTMLNWSFVRNDLSREAVANQIALALAEEVLALEAAGIEMIQVDEPALREGLPLKQADHDEYLQWAVRAFRLATSAVKDTTQIHTHMCYSEFHDMMEAIRELDADVISIETSRSHGELIRIFEQVTYDKEIGLGVYDIHSPRIPPVSEMVDLIERSLTTLDPDRFWINPDCGLKTRSEQETRAALKHMVEAAHRVRHKLWTDRDRSEEQECSS